MHRIFTILVLAIGLATHSSAAMIEFMPGTVPQGENRLEVVFDNTVFEISDQSNPAPNDFQFDAITPIDVQVIANGGALPVTYTLARLATATNRINVVFTNPAYSNLLLWFDVPGIAKGDPIPSGTITDVDGRVRWNAPGLYADAAGEFPLAGSLDAARLINRIPEPTGIAIPLAVLSGTIIYLRRHRR